VTRSILYRIQKTVTWEAAHQLMGLPKDHQCSNMHGHSYRAEITLSSNEVDEVGFVIDFGVISKIVKETYDHKVLNDVMPDNPTAEHLAEHLAELILTYLFKIHADKAVKLESVRVYETATSWAEVVIVEAP
jgi:6-pyruvoyltetrahydropterin/6-carboxytetrahydropterin synthase